MYSAMQKLVEFRDMIDHQDTLSMLMVRRLALRLVDREMPNPRKKIRTPKIKLNTHEIYEGQYTGKVACIRAYRERTNKSLVDAKNDCEKFFADNGFKFKGYQ